MRPHYWLPEKTRNGDHPRCDNCDRFEACKAERGRDLSGHVCGNWEEARAYQITLAELLRH